MAVRIGQVGNASLQGFTAVYGLFIVPHRTAAPLELAFSDDAAVAAAYARTRPQPTADARCMQVLTTAPSSPHRYARTRTQPAAVAAAKATAAAAAAAAAERAAAGRSMAELAEALRALTAGKLKKMMGRLGIGFIPGLEKEEYVASECL